MKALLPFVIAGLVLVAEPLAASARAYSIVGSPTTDTTGDVDPGDVTRTGDLTGNLLVLICSTTTGADAPAMTMSGETVTTPISTLWINSLRRTTAALVLQVQNAADRVLVCDIPGGDTAVYDILAILEYDGAEGGEILDSDTALTLDGDDTEISVPTLTGGGGTNVYFGIVHHLNAVTGDGLSDHAVGGFTNSNTISDKSGSGDATIRWTWTGASWAGALGFKVAESAGGPAACPVCAGVNSPIRGGGLLATLRTWGVARPFAPRLVGATIKRGR